jgi:hypothetical protein
MSLHLRRQPGAPPRKSGRAVDQTSGRKLSTAIGTGSEKSWDRENFPHRLGILPLLNRDGRPRVERWRYVFNGKTARHEWQFNINPAILTKRTNHFPRAGA